MKILTSYIWIAILFISACSKQEAPQTPPEPQFKKSVPTGNQEFSYMQEKDFEKRRVRFLEEGLSGEVEMERFTPHNSQNDIKQSSLKTSTQNNILTEQDFATTVNTTPKQSQEKVIEITGNNRIAEPKLEEELLLPSTFIRHKFIISTSPSYNGIYLEEARNKLENFGTTKTVREGEKFAIKLYPKVAFATEEEAKEMLRKIIKLSFFDVYIEQVK